MHILNLKHDFCIAAKVELNIRFSSISCWYLTTTVTMCSISFHVCIIIAVRLDFSPPFGEKGYRVSEQDEYLEVCIRLASTGSQEELLSSVEVIVTYEDQSATGMIH